MERRHEISIYEIRIATALRKAESWMSNRDIGTSTKIPERTVRAHTKKLHHLGLLDRREVFPGHRFKWSDKAENHAYLQRLSSAAEVFGLEWRKPEKAAKKGA